MARFPTVVAESTFRGTILSDVPHYEKTINQRHHHIDRERTISTLKTTFATEHILSLNTNSVTPAEICYRVYIEEVALMDIPKLLPSTAYNFFPPPVRRVSE